MEHREYKSINKSVRKKDSMQLLLGKPVYTDYLGGCAGSEVYECGTDLSRGITV